MNARQTLSTEILSSCMAITPRSDIRSSAMVDLKQVFILPNKEKQRSASALVIGSVHDIKSS